MNTNQILPFIPKINIIIPFYNIEDYIEKCLDSVLQQDMPDFEIIAVNDDGSTDKTPALLDKYAKKDCRIHVLHKKIDFESI
jgi:glycosyltransferase involved in cell wall biosynthesis